MVIGSLIASGLMSFFRDASGDVPPSVISMLLYVYITIAGVSALCFAFLGRETYGINRKYNCLADLIY